MAIFSVYVVNKAGGLIYQYDNYVPRTEVEKTFSFPLDLVLKIHDEKVVVSFGQRDGIRGACLCVCKPSHVLMHICRSGNLLFLWIKWIVFFCAVGHALLSINGVDVNGKYTAEGKEIQEYLKDPANYPVSIKFGRQRLSSNEKLMLASMFHSWVYRCFFL